MEKVRTTEQFITKSKGLFGEFLDYTDTQYKGNRVPLTVKCPHHGDVLVKPRDHFRSLTGCPLCGRAAIYVDRNERKPKRETFITNSTKVFGDLYDYTNSVYLRGDLPIDIKCKIHGVYTVARAEKHYMRAQGCPSCVTGKSHGELAICAALDEQGVLYHREYKFEDCRSPYSNHKLRFDFWIPSNGMIIEYHGDQHFKESTLFHSKGNFARMQEHDRIKKVYALERGYTFLEITTKDLTMLRDIITGIS